MFLEEKEKKKKFERYNFSYGINKDLIIERDM